LPLGSRASGAGPIYISSADRNLFIFTRAFASTLPKDDRQDHPHFKDDGDEKDNEDKDNEDVDDNEDDKGNDKVEDNDIHGQGRKAEGEVEVVKVEIDEYDD
jgi:hypothetical protein